VTIRVSIPSLLEDCAGGKTRFDIEGTTLAEALQTLFTDYPLLRLHLYDEAQRPRQHVLLFYNDQNIARLARLDLPLQPGDRITVLQNVSGG